MPLIKIETSVKCSPGQRSAVLLELSKSCATILRKPESYVQVCISDSATFSHGGKIQDCAFADVRSIGGRTRTPMRNSAPRFAKA